MGCLVMEVRKFWRSYSQLLEFMLEHAQMEERILFPVFEKADRGLSKTANEEHARDLPIMNGIKERINTIGVLDVGNPVYQEQLISLLSMLKILQFHASFILQHHCHQPLIIGSVDWDVYMEEPYEEEDVVTKVNKRKRTSTTT